MLQQQRIGSRSTEGRPCAGVGAESAHQQTDALQAILAGAKAKRREPKVAYGGADGLPIREEVLARHGDDVITRNAYGARCLNTPRLLMADIDFATVPLGWPEILAHLASLVLAFAIGFGFGVWLAVIYAIGAAIAISRVCAQWRITHGEQIALRRIDAYLKRSSGALRIYRTPAGLRLIDISAPRSADEPYVKTFFRAVGCDPTYARMCLLQRCFRARLSAKPWRIGIDQHIRPRRAAWPVHPDKLEQRSQWIAAYEERARNFSACRYLETRGSKDLHLALASTVTLHDEASGALRDLDLA